MATHEPRLAATIHYLRTAEAPGHRVPLQDGSVCPHCDGERVQKWGGFSGRQRYRCRDCRRTFSTFTDTPLHRLKHPERWPRFLACHDARLTLRATGVVLGSHKDTALRYRHRLLDHWRREPRRGLEGRVVIGDFSIPHSDKGGRYLQRPARRRGEEWTFPSLQTGPVTVLVALESSRIADGPRCRVSDGAPLRASQGPAARGSAAVESTARAMVIESLGVGRVHGPDYDCRIAPRLGQVTEIVGIRGPSCPQARFAGRVGAIYRREAGSFFPDDIFLVRRELRTWLRPFRGVATRRLDNYLEWYRRRGRRTGRQHSPRTEPYRPSAQPWRQAGSLSSSEWRPRPP